MVALLEMLVKDRAQTSCHFNSEATLDVIRWFVLFQGTIIGLVELI